VFFDRLLDGVEWLRKLDAISPGLNHPNGAAQMSFRTFQAQNDVEMRSVKSFVVYVATLSSGIGCFIK
jgi:hypothetical protein